MQLPSFIRDLPPIVKTSGLAIVLMSAGWSGHVMFAQQISLPANVSQTMDRVTVLETRMTNAEAILADYQMTTRQIGRLNMRVDSLFTLAERTYCIVEAQMLHIDPFTHCTLRGRSE
jgi:hypothetical protein